MSSEEERVNNLLGEIRMLEATYNELSARQNVLERILIESRSSLETIRSLGATPAEEVLVPVGAGVLLRASPPKVDKVLVNLGANVVVEKSREDAAKVMEERAQSLEKDIMALATQRSQIAQRVDSDRMAVQTIVNRAGQK